MYSLARIAILVTVVLAYTWAVELPQGLIGKWEYIPEESVVAMDKQKVVKLRPETADKVKESILKKRGTIIIDGDTIQISGFITKPYTIINCWTDDADDTYLQCVDNDGGSVNSKVMVRVRLNGDTLTLLLVIRNDLYIEVYGRN